jgi:hypothetical protein
MKMYRDAQYSVVIWGSVVAAAWTAFSVWVGVPWYMTFAIDIGIAIGALLVPHELTTTVTSEDVRLQWTLFGWSLHKPLIIPVQTIEKVEVIAKEEIGPPVWKTLSPKYPANDVALVPYYSEHRRTHIADSRAKRAVVMRVPGDLEGAPYIILSKYAEEIARDVESQRKAQ